MVNSSGLLAMAKRRLIEYRQVMANFYESQLRHVEVDSVGRCVHDPRLPQRSSGQEADDGGA
jgi:hypothetical protein